MSGIVIIGPGAIGSLLGARLFEHGHEVLLIARGKRLQALQRDGVVISESDTVRQVPVPVADRCDADNLPDQIIIATKTFQLPGALDLLEPYRDAEFGILTVQNGVEAPDIVQSRLPSARVLGSRMHGFFELEGQVVKHTGVPPGIQMGPVAAGFRDATHEQISRNLAEILQNSGIMAELVDDVRPALWEKFVMAATIGGVAPAFGLTVGQVSQHTGACSMLEGAMQEVAAIATAQGIALPKDCVARKMEFISRFPPDVTSSLQRDLEAQRPSEFAQLTGAIPRLAHRAGLTAPIAEEVIEMLRARELIID